MTLTLEHRPDSRLILKLEGRYDDSTAPAFSGRDGAQKRQFLLLLGAVATFQEVRPCCSE
ncbi:MAG: outer membrane beta-barrel protein [Vicinamibacteria bacterium]|nr:outer membrane beta-barrel protein [Vicinamibacteria bacterium]